MLDEFIYSKPLKSLVYDRRSSDLDSLDSFLMQLLHSNSNLKHFKMKYPTELVVTKCLIEKLMSSNLKSCLLDIDGNVKVRDLDSVVSCSSDEHKTAASPSLTIRLSYIHIYRQRNIVSLLQCLPNLHHLQMHIMTPNILQTLFQYQVNICIFYSHSIFNISAK